MGFCQTKSHFLGQLVSVYACNDVGSSADLARLASAKYQGSLGFVAWMQLADCLGFLVGLRIRKQALGSFSQFSSSPGSPNRFFSFHL